MFQDSDDESSDSYCYVEDHAHHASESEEGSSSFNDQLDPSLLMARCIIHLDIDCFYCQCEEILNPSLAQKPLAIGQKHIIVTANYVARKLGIKKLMGRHDALRVCPALTVIEGSDLEKYRKASREVYDEFRDAVKEYGQENVAKKGSMDEMFADITFAAMKYSVESNQNELIDKSDNPQKTFVYGVDGESNIVRISEDQSGAEATIGICNNYHSIQNKPSSQMYFRGWGSDDDKNICEKKLQNALIIAGQIRDRIRSKTKFSTTIGVSVSPLLAKLASDLKVSYGKFRESIVIKLCCYGHLLENTFKKPDSTNLLYPWLANTIIHDMPLRRIPGLGSKTYKVLSRCLECFNETKRDDDFWTCR